MNAMKQKPKTVTGHHKHKRKGRQPANPGQPKEKKKSTWAAINEKNYLCNLCGKTLKGLTAYKRHQVCKTLGNMARRYMRSLDKLYSFYYSSKLLCTFSIYRLFILVHDLMNVMCAEKHLLKINV